MSKKILEPTAVTSGFDFELWVARLLRYGVLLVAVVLLVGWLSEIHLSENIFLRYQTYHHVGLRDALELAVDEKSWGLLLSYGGLAMLICLPALRVVMTAILFAKQKEFIMSGICLIVMVGLILSALLGQL